MNDKKDTILLIDDDEELCEAIGTYLKRHNYNVEFAHVPSKAYELISSNRPDLILLDIMLPEEDGFEVCKKLVSQVDVYGYIPIIMLTARGDVFDRVVGLEIGASDYLPKPFEPRELLARIRSTLRQTSFARDQRTKKSQTVVIPTRGIYIEEQAQQVWLDGQLLKLTAMEYSLLNLFVSLKGNIISRDQIMDYLRGSDASVYSRAIDALVKRLRKKLGDDSNSPRFIKTIWGRGYEFLGCDLKSEVDRV